MTGSKDASNLPPDLARALRTVPTRALKAFLTLCEHADDEGRVSMSASQLADRMSTAEERVSHDTALRSLHALDKRYGGSGHIEHVGTRPTDAVYALRTFASIRTDASVRTDASIRTDAVRTYAKVRIYAPPIPPLIYKTKTTTTNQARADISDVAGAEESGGGGGFRTLKGRGKDNKADAQDGPHGGDSSPTAAGRKDAPAAFPFTPMDLDARLAALQAAGIGSDKVRNRLARTHTVEEIAAAVKLAKQYGKGGGAVVHELDEGNAAEHLSRRAKKAAAAPTPDTPTPANTSPEKRTTVAELRAAAVQRNADIAQAAADADRIDGTDWKTLCDAARAALRRDPANAAVLVKRGKVDAAWIASDDGTPGWGALHGLCKHPLIRAAVIAELDLIESGTPRVVPDADTTNAPQEHQT